MEIGTLWFGADIDLTKLKQKIQSGNQSILDALKISYDPHSYNQMVSKLKAQLATETFGIKINANTQNLVQNLRNSLGSKTGLSGGLDSLNQRIENQIKAVNALKESYNKLKISYETNKNGSWAQQMTANAQKKQMDRIALELEGEKRTLADMIAHRNTLRRATQDYLLTMRKEKTLHKETAKTAEKTTNQRINYVRQLNSDSIRLNTTLAGGVHISTQLGSALSGVFALDYIRQFLNNVIEIGGQLEKQRISIGAILGDTVKATHLFEQIKGLALKSPFGVVELDQYTKQLSAYGFKYNELFDMTKRLADISAGAGTDIGRLTLALGHVRSATYLTGITLRQFSMNNIPMLKMLADYYSEVEKRAVSTAEVQQRISKRQVSYEDVIEQIRRLTDEGGMFYNMQEKISESLSAKFKNLRDAMDIMYGEMAESSIGTFLKNVAAALLQVTRHWSEVAHVLGVAGAAFVLSKLNIAANTIAMNTNTAAMVKQILANKQSAAAKLREAAFTKQLTIAEKAEILTSTQLRAADIQKALTLGVLNKEEALRLITLKKIKIAQAMHLKGIQGITEAEIRAAVAAKSWRVALEGVGASIKNLFLGISKGTWFTIGSMVAMELYTGYREWSDKIDEKAKEMTDLIKSRVNDLKKIRKSIDEDGKPKDKTALKSRIDEMKQVLANSEEYTKTIDEQLSKTTDLNNQYDILVTAIDNAAEKNRKMLDYQGEVANMIKASKGDFSWWDIPKAGIFSLSSFKNIWNQLFDEDINKNMQQTLESYKDLRTVIDNAWEYKDAIKGVIEEMVKSGEISESFAEQLKKTPFEEQIRLLAESGYWQTIVDKIASTDSNFITFANNIKNASNGVTDKWKEIATNDIPKMMQKVASERHISEQELNKWCLNNIDDFKMMLDGIADQLEIKEPEIRNRLKRLFYNYVSFGKLAQGNVSQEVLSQTEKDLMDFIGVEDENLKKLLGYDEKAVIKDNTNQDPTKGDKKDKALEAAKTKLAQYKAFLSEYKKYIEIYDKEDAINLLKDLFPDLKDEKGNFLGLQLVDNYTAVLDKLRSSIEATTEARKKLHNDIDRTKADTQFDREKQSLKENADAMKEYYTKMEEQWKNYRSLLEKSGGNRDIAQMAFNDKGRVWDEVAKDMMTKFVQRAKELDVSYPELFDWNMNENELKHVLKNSNGEIQAELIDLAKEIQKVTRDNFVKFTEDTATAYKKSLTEAQKLKELEEQRNDLIKQRNAANSDELKSKYNILIAAKEKEIANQTWEAFKETEEWGRIFANLDNISTTTLDNMLQKLRETAPQLKKNEEVTKQVYEAIEKIQTKLAERSPFKMIADGFTDASKVRAAIKVASSDKSGSVIANADLARILNVKVGSKVSKNKLQDSLRELENKIPEGLRGLAGKFKALQDVIQPVIDLFDQLGMTEISDFFNMGNNAFGAAVQTASGLGTLGLGNLGPYGAAAAAGLSIISSVFAMHDKALQKEIEASEHRQKLMENLTKNIEKLLERTLGGVYNTKATGEMLTQLRKEISSQSIFGLFGYKNYISDRTRKAVQDAERTKTYYDTAYASLLAQRDELQHQMELEEDKKKSDKNAIDDYKQQLTEMDDEIRHFAEDMAKTLYDIDIKSWAQELGDALFEAWQKGEDGAEAFKKKASEIMAEVAKSIAVTKLIETAMQPVLDEIVSEMKRTKGQLDEQSVENIAAKMEVVSETLPGSFNKLMDGLNEGMKKAGLEDMKKLGDDTDATKNGIGKAITEQDTSLWASYLNAIRLDVSVMRATENIHLPAISTDVHRVSVLAQAQVDHLQRIADNTKRNADAADKIYEAMHRIETGATRVAIK